MRQRFSYVAQVFREKRGGMPLRWLGHATICTEARQSIRSALDDYRELEVYLASSAGSAPSFERLVQNSSVSAGCKRFEGTSCGNTVQCFASIFLNRTRINQDDIYSVLSGGALLHLWSTPNLFLCTVVGVLPNFLFRGCNANAVWFRTSMCERFQCAMARARAATLLHFPRYCRAAATAQVHSFREQLLLEEHTDHLPRVFFLSLTWVLEDSLSAHLGSEYHQREEQLQTGKVSDVWNGFQDHTFAFIKRASPQSDRSAYEYQCIQGYMDSATEEGYDMLGWQKSGSPFCKSSGFGRETLDAFLAHLQAFAKNIIWDGKNHAAAFLVQEDRFSGKPYLPSFVCRELQDSHIIGWGERPMSEYLRSVTRDS